MGLDCPQEGRLRQGGQAQRLSTESSVSTPAQRERQYVRATRRTPLEDRRSSIFHNCATAGVAENNKKISQSFWDWGCIPLNREKGKNLIRTPGIVLSFHGNFDISICQR
jgi:hypothetical protein